MKSSFLPYKRHYDRATRTYACIGVDTHGSDFGTGSGATKEDALDELRASILDSLLAAAGDGQDFTRDLHEADPGGERLEFTTLDLFPIHLRLRRVSLGLRQVDLAASMGITQQAYSKLEKPGANPTLQTVMQAERGLKESLLELA